MIIDFDKANGSDLSVRAVFKNGKFLGTDIEVAAERGRKDFNADYQLSDNPYHAGTELFKQWAKGFLDALNELNN